MGFLERVKGLNNQEEASFSKFMNLEFYFLLFVAGSIIGWLYEEFFFIFIEKWVENRGFLYGPYLPVYGFGTIFMVLLIKRFKKKPVEFFLLAMLLTGVLEYFTGVTMWAIWQRKWWDYTGLFCNIGGYVCLRSVISFAIGGLVLVYLVEPAIRQAVAKSSQRKVNRITTACFIIMLVDMVITLTIRHPIHF